MINIILHYFCLNEPNPNRPMHVNKRKLIFFIHTFLMHFLLPCVPLEGFSVVFGFHFSSGSYIKKGDDVRTKIWHQYTLFFKKNTFTINTVIILGTLLIVITYSACSFSWSCFSSFRFSFS